MTKTCFVNFQDFKKLMDRIQKLSNLIENTSDINLRNQLIREYYQLSILLSDVYGYVDPTSFSNKYILEYGQNLSFMLADIRKKTDMCLKDMQSYLKTIYSNYMRNVILPPEVEQLDFEKMITLQDLTEEFLNWIDPFILNLYHEMNSDKRIFDRDKLIILGSDQGETISTNVYDKRDYIIMKVAYDNPKYFSVLVHELGHVYEHNNIEDVRYGTNRELTKEVTSILFQRLFYDFLLQNPDFYNNTMGQKATWDANQAMQAMSYTVVNSERDNVNYNENGLFKYNGDKTQITELFNMTVPSIDMAKYIISDLIACRFLNMFKDSKKEALKELIEFYKRRNTIHFNKLLEEYGSADAFNTEYNKSASYVLKRD